MGISLAKWKTRQRNSDLTYLTNQKFAIQRGVADAMGCHGMPWDEHKIQTAISDGPLGNDLSRA